MNLRVTLRATRDYKRIHQYIQETFGDGPAAAFELRTKSLLQRLALAPTLGTLDLPEKGIYGFQLTRQTRVLYRFKGEELVVLSFFDIRRNRK
jgi:plasmid stabilization system protein ParE